MPPWLNPPNLITLARLAVAPFVAAAILDGRHLFALALFTAAAASDAIDGPLARRFHWITSTGAYLDPIADKVLMSAGYIAMAVIHTVPWWFVGVIFGRDILILAFSGAALLFTRVRKFEPSVWGKLSTFLQVVTGVTWMVRNVQPTPTLDSIAAGLIWPATAATVWSGIHYGWRGYKLLRTASNRLT